MYDSLAQGAVLDYWDLVEELGGLAEGPGRDPKVVGAIVRYILLRVTMVVCSPGTLVTEPELQL
jgi:hypothetical protein